MSRRHPGFTLLELLLALSITVMIAGTLATALHVAYRARASAERAIIAGRTTGLITQIIARDLENALQPTGILASEFTGAVDTLSFCSTTPDPGAVVPGDIKRIEYQLVTSTQGRNDLVRRVQPNLLQPIEIELTDEPICRGVTQLELSYYDGSTWTDTWDSAAQNNTLPLAVRVTMEILPPGNDAQPLHCDQFVQILCATAATSGTSGVAQ